MAASWARGKDRHGPALCGPLATLAVAGFLAVLALAGCGRDEGSPTVLVTHVTDGDTVRLASGETVRIRGLDTPETKRPNTPVQCWGPEATKFAADTLLNKQVRIIINPADERDRYGRLVAELWLGDRSYADLAVAAGAGRAYLYNRKHPTTDWPRIKAAEAAARRAHLGLWGACGNTN